MGNQACCGPRKIGQKIGRQEEENKLQQNGQTKQNILDEANDVDKLLSQGYHEGKQDLLTKRILPGRRSVSMAQNAGIIEKDFLDRKPIEDSLPISHDQKVITSKGQDTREKILQNAKYPFCSIGMISMDFVDSQGRKLSGFGTGCLIHKKTVLTCAHNVYDRDRGLQAYQVYFIPAMCGTKGRRYRATKFYYPEQYRTAKPREQYEWDFALMELDATDLSEQYGYLGINTMMNGEQQAMLYGYPMDLNKEEGKKYLFGTSGRVRQSKRNVQQLNYDMPTASGQSGSPIIRKVGKNNYQVIGIHTRYIEGAKTGERDNAQENCNSGVKFTEYCKSLINRWVQVMNRQLVVNKKSFQKNFFKQLMNKKWEQWNNLTRINFSSNNITGQMLFYMTSNEKRYPNLISLNLSDNNIEDQGMRSLTKNINAFPNLEQLVLNHNKIAKEGVRFLIEGNDCFPILSALYLSQNQIDGKAIDQLTKNPSAFPLLDDLDLGQNLLERSESSSLALITTVFPNLTQFGIRRNGLGDSGIKKLFKDKKAFTSASQIGLANNLISSEGIKAMTDSGKNHFPNLTRLWLQNNILQADGAKWLSRNSVFPALVELQIYSNGLGQQGVLELTKIAGSFNKLQQLGLQHNQIGNGGCRWLSENHRSMPNLKILFLDTNNIDDQGMHNLIQNRQAFPRLHTLSLVGNNIGPNSMKYLMYQNEAFFNLQALYLQKNKIGDQGIEYLAENLGKVFKRLRALGLRENGITNQGVRHVAKNYKSFHNVRTIGLNMNSIDSDGIDILVDANIELPNLENLWLAGNKLRPTDLDRFKEKYPHISIK